MSCNPSSVWVGEICRALVFSITDAYGLGYAFRKIELSIKALHGRKK